jgi:hypothetical protein
LRIRIPSRRKDHRYFERLRGEFLRLESLERVEVNPVTGSVLLTGSRLDPVAVENYARSQGLFDLRQKKPSSAPVTRTIVEPLGTLSSGLKRITGGRLDLPGLVFILLLASGISEIIKGNFRAPPWYTAFWYAFGVFTKSLVDMVHKSDEAA